MPKSRVPRADFDSPWKEALQHFLAPFLALFFPEIHADLDWSRGYESLDKELHRIARAGGGSALADKLFKVWEVGGAAAEVYLLIHIEVQGEPENDFSERMFRYNVRAFDRYNRDVISLAVLSDERLDWRPTGFAYGKWRARTAHEFLSVKLLDWRGRETELEASDNPFAAVVLAHLQALATRHDSEARHRSKLALVKGLYQRGWDAEAVRQLFRVIDWLLELPDELKRSFIEELHAWEEEKRMPYVTSVEQYGFEKGLAKGRQEGLLEGLLKAIQTTLVSRFGKSAARLMPRVRQITAAEELHAFLNDLVRAENLREVRERLAERQE